MKQLKNIFRASGTACLALAMMTGSVQGQTTTTTIANDDFSNGRDATGSLEVGFFSTSTPGAIEANAGSVGLVSGPSGRQIHALFPTVTLGLAGDVLSGSVSFTTPATVLNQGGDDLRFGIFDNLGRTGADQLGQDISASSTNPNPDLNGLNGYAFELDVEPSTVTNQDVQIRRSDPSTTGRLLGTNTGISALSSGPDAGYVFTPNTDYFFDFSYERNDAGGIELTGTLLDSTGVLATHSDTDDAPGSFDFGFLGIGASTDAFGSSNVAGEADNGIDITNVTLNFTTTTAAIPEPSSTALLLAGLSSLLMVRRRNS